MEFDEVEIRALEKGDEKVFRKLYQHFFVALCVFARHFSLEYEEAEDVVQEAFFRLYDERVSFANFNALRSYLYTLVRNRSLNYLRDEKRRRSREERFFTTQEEEHLYDATLENEIYRQLHLLLEELPPQCRNIFQQTLEGKTSEEIAAGMGLSVETVKTQRKKAKKMMRERYMLLFRTFAILFSF